jgi:hypothetical protein
VGPSIVKGTLPNLTLLVWSVFEGGWLIVFLAAFILIEYKSILHRALLLASIIGLGTVFSAGMLVGDAVRSQQYAFPLLLVAIAVVGRTVGALPLKLQRTAVLLTLFTPITLYTGWEVVANGLIYNNNPLRPGYIYLLRL